MEKLNELLRKAERITRGVAKRTAVGTMVNLSRLLASVVISYKFDEMAKRINNPKLSEKLLSEIKAEGGVEIIFEDTALQGAYNPIDKQIVISDDLKNNPFVLAHEYGHHKAGFIGKIFSLLEKKETENHLPGDGLPLSVMFDRLKFPLYLLLQFSPLSKKLTPFQKAAIIILASKGPVLLEELLANAWALYKVGKEDLKSLKEGIPFFLLSYSTYLVPAIFDFLLYYTYAKPITDD
jgi:hypothetical protein